MENVLGHGILLFFDLERTAESIFTQQNKALAIGSPLDVPCIEALCANTTISHEYHPVSPLSTHLMVRQRILPPPVPLHYHHHHPPVLRLYQSTHRSTNTYSLYHNMLPTHLSVPDSIGYLVRAGYV